MEVTVTPRIIHGITQLVFKSDLAPNGICLKIREVYPHGARLIIASDGRVILRCWQTWFPDLTVADVDAYASGIEALIGRIGGGDNLAFLRTLDEAYPGMSFEEVAERFHSDWAPTVESVRSAVREEDSPASLAYKGTKRYFVNDGLDSRLSVGLSKEAIKRISKGAAIEALQNSDALTAFLNFRFPRAIHLSVHPQAAHDPRKLGFHLTATQDGWLTPWHAVALFVEETQEWLLTKRYLAERARAVVVHVEGLPRYFYLPSGNPRPEKE